MIEEVREISFLICDDEKEVADLLERYLREFIDLLKIQHYNIQVFHNGDEMDCAKVYADIAMVDVEVGSGISGINAGDHLRRQNPEVILIIVTGYPQYLDEAMGKNVFRYISKPVNKGRLFRALREAFKKYENQTRKIHFVTDSGGIIIPTQEILCIEAQKHNVILHTVNGDFKIRDTFRDCCCYLEGCGFMQTHRSYMVNLAHVASYDHSTVYLEATAYAQKVKNGEKVFVPYRMKCQAFMTYRKYYALFRKALIRFLEVNQ